MKYSSNRLINLMVLSSIAGFIIISIALILIFTDATLKNYNNSLKNINVEYNKRARIAAEDNINKVITFINIYEKTLRKNANTKVKDNVEFGLKIIKSIYTQHEGFPKNIILQKIKDELRDIRFFSNKTGYFFIYTLKGKCILLPTIPKLEGTNQINLQDSKKEYIMQKFISIVEHKKEGFDTWWWYKPHEHKMKKKLGFVKIFEPLDIFIGTARYEEDILDNIKKEIIKYLLNIEKNQYGYIFAYDFSGNGMIEKNSFKEINKWNNIIKGRHIVRDAIRGAQIIPNGFFMRYTSKQNKQEFSYIKLIPDLNLIIGTKVENTKELYKKQKKYLKDMVNKTIRNTILIAIAVLVFMSVLFLILLIKIKKLFKVLENRLNFKTKELIDQKNIFETLFDKSHDGVFLSKNKKIIDCNEAMFKMAEAKNKQEFLNIEIEKLFPEFQEDGKNSLEKLEKMFDIVQEKDYNEFEFKARTLKGEEIWIDFVITELRLNDGTMRHFVIRDITDRKRIEKEFQLQQEKLIFQANHDSLTSLPNRILLMDRLYQNMKKAIRNKKVLAVLFLDIDNFKNVNDAYGHDVGDMLLIKIADILKSQTRTTDVVSRFGGDEFVVVLEDLSNISDSSLIIQKILKRFQKPFIFENNSLKVTFSIGASIFPNDAKDEQTLLKYADIALYKAKGRGKNQSIYYDESMNTNILEHIKVEQELRNAIENDEFILYYQPQFEVGTKKIVGLEALVRWNHPIKGLVYPDYFIQIAEDSDLIIEMGNIISKKAMKQIKEWNDKGYNLGIMSINFTAKQLDCYDFFETFEKLLAQTNCKGHWIEVELIERYIMKNSKESIQILERFKDMGIGVAIDDFGTGYSSLNYLKYLQITKLKIDKSFIDDIVTNKKDKAITQSIIDLSKGLDLKVLAEGVETKEQYELLTQMGCEIIQGYYFSKPLTKEGIEKLIEGGL